jgi:hypothetical protein
MEIINIIQIGIAEARFLMSFACRMIHERVAIFLIVCTTIVEIMWYERCSSGGFLCANIFYMMMPSR